MLLFISVMLVGCNNTSNETNKNLKSIEISIYDKAEKLIYDEKIETEKKTLLEALKSIEELKIETEDSEYGAFITSIKRIKQEDDYYWNYYVNGEYATAGISSYNVKENDKFKFVLEKFE